MAGQKDSGRSGRWTKRLVFQCQKLKEAAGADADLTTSKIKTDTPTAYFPTVKPDTLRSGFIHRIHYRLNPANAVTYTLRIWCGAVAGDYESNMKLLYETPAAQVKDTDYDKTELNIPFVLDAEGTLYYSIEWSGATGNIQGFMEVSGEMSE